MKRYAAYRTSLAPASRTVGSIALALAVIAFLVQRIGLIEPDVFVLSLMGGGVVAIAALVLAMIALHRIWTYGGPGVPAALGGCLLALVTLAAPVLVIALLIASPGAEDLTTNRADPPPIRGDGGETAEPFLTWLNTSLQQAAWPGLLRQAGGQLAGEEASQDPAGANAENRQNLYPDIVSRRYRISPGQLHVAGAKALQSLDWRVVDELPPDLLDSPTRLQAERTTQVLGLTYDVTLRVRPDPVGALLDIRSRSRTPLNELTDNADHIRAVFAEIDRVLLETYGDLARLSVEEGELEDDGSQAEPLQVPRQTIPLPGFKPYREEEDELPPDGLDLTDLEG